MVVFVYLSGTWFRILKFSEEERNKIFVIVNAILSCVKIIFHSCQSNDVQHLVYSFEAKNFHDHMKW